MSSPASSPKDGAGAAVAANGSADLADTAASVKNGSATEDSSRPKLQPEEDADSGSDLFDDDEEDGGEGGRSDKGKASSRPKRSRANDEDDEEDEDAIKPVARRQRKAGIE